MAVGRNDLCPCGSGKKYKKCCLSNAQPKPENLFWHRLNTARTGLPIKMIKFIDQIYGKAALHEAWNEFHLFKDIPFDYQSPELPIFMPWFFYFWTPDLEETNTKKTAPSDFPPAAALLELKSWQLEELERKYIKTCLNSPFSFFEILDCDPGEGFKFRDIFTGKPFDVVEKKGSESARIGDILFAQAVTVDKLTTLEASSHFLIPPINKRYIIDLRKHIQTQHNPILPDNLFKYDIELLELYQELKEILFNPPTPEICNIDGDPLTLYELIYDIDSAETVFNALKGLDFVETGKSILKKATFDKNGKLNEVEFPWLKRASKQDNSWGNPILGHIKITRTTLKVEVNSEKRAKQFRVELKKRIEKGVRYKTTIIESLEGKVRNKQTNSTLSKEQEDIMNDPDVQAQIVKMMEAQWENWINENIPALDNKTPIEASKTEDGRELLDSILTQFERESSDNHQTGATQETFLKLRKKLGLVRT